MDLMLSILSCDGSYEDLAYILPYTLSATVITYYQKHRAYDEVVNLMNDNKQMPSNELDEIIENRFKASRQTIFAEYLNHTKHLLKRVIVPNLGILEKKILVSPSNVADAHWIVTFVFYASYFQHEIVAEVDSGWLQPCFHRYCSLVTDGSRYASTEEGIPWFLNFCYSFELHKRTKQNATDPMKWYAPYGSSSEKRLLGTRKFPHCAFAIEAKFLIRKTDSIVVLVLVLVLQFCCGISSKRRTMCHCLIRDPGAAKTAWSSRKTR